MVNAAVDMEYAGKIYREGDKLPDDLVKHLELHDPSLLDNHILINGIWKKIDEPLIKGWVEENKNSDYRLRKYFGKIKIEQIKDEKGNYLGKKIVPLEKPEEKEDNSHILIARPKVKEEPKKSPLYTKEDLEEKSFSELRKIGIKLGVKGRSKEGLIKDILKVI